MLCHRSELIGSVLLVAKLIRTIKHWTNRRDTLLGTKTLSLSATCEPESSQEKGGFA